MKNLILLVLCFCGFGVHAEVRTWTGAGGDLSWTNGNNWSPVTCKTMNELGGFVYTTGYVPPRPGEIVIFSNVGTLTLINAPGGIILGNTAFTDYSVVLNGCIGAPPSTLNLYSLQILGNSNIDIVGTGIITGGSESPMAGYNEALKIQSSTLTCLSLKGNYASYGGDDALNMNSVNAGNSTLFINTPPSGGGGFYTSGRSYFYNCTINTVWFSPSSNNDFPSEIDEFIGCTINADRVYFFGDCIAVATNCTFNIRATGNPEFSLNSFATQNSVTLNNVQINVDAGATGQLFISYQPGASVINGNINCNSTDPDFQVTFQNSSNIPTFPIKINGNLVLQNGSIYVGNQGILDITGNLVMNGTADPNLNKDVTVNNQTVFQIGGVSNYMNYNTGSYGPIPGGQPFGIKFSGTGDSHVIWPTGFPVDTLTIEKTGCGKLYIDNQPLHVTGKLHVKSGQLILKPLTGLSYVMVNGANTLIEPGGSIVLNSDAGSNKSHVALGGDLVDLNTVNNPATCNGFSNPHTADIAFYYNEYSPLNRIIKILNAPNFGNVKLINTNIEAFTLSAPLTIQNFDLGTQGKIKLGINNLYVDGNITGFDTDKFIVTESTGTLRLKNIGIGPIVFPVGPTTDSYNPLTITNNGTVDDFTVRVFNTTLTRAITGDTIISNALNKSWFIEESVAGGSNADIALQWNSVDELPGFDRDNNYMAHFLPTAGWSDTGTIGSASGSGIYTRIRTGFTNFSPFTITSEPRVLNASTYSFTGNGNWTVAANWNNNIVPFANLPNGAIISIDPSGIGECILNISQIVLPGGQFIVQPGKKLIIQGNLLLFE